MRFDLLTIAQHERHRCGGGRSAASGIAAACPSIENLETPNDQWRRRHILKRRVRAIWSGVQKRRQKI
jgi:hypothetical protein